MELDDNVLIQLDATTDNGMDNTVFCHYWPISKLPTTTENGTLLLTHYLEIDDACMTIRADFIDDGAALAKYSVTPEFEDDMNK